MNNYDKLTHRSVTTTSCLLPDIDEGSTGEEEGCSGTVPVRQHAEAQKGTPSLYCKMLVRLSDCNVMHY